RLIREQLAADLLPEKEQDPRSLAALGFLTVGRRVLNNQQDILDDRMDVVTRGLLGLTVACARCHDHKFDPIPTDDYYSLFGVFASSVEPADLPEIPSPIPAQLNAEFNARIRINVFRRGAFDVGFSMVRRDPKVDERARVDKLPTGRLRAFSARWK